MKITTNGAKGKCASVTHATVETSRRFDKRKALIREDDRESESVYATRPIVVAQNPSEWRLRTTANPSRLSASSVIHFSSLCRIKHESEEARPTPVMFFGYLVLVYHPAGSCVYESEATSFGDGKGRTQLSPRRSVWPVISDTFSSVNSSRRFYVEVDRVGIGSETRWAILVW